MDVFQLNRAFDTYQSLLDAKKSYEIASNTVLVIEDCHNLREGDVLRNVIRYDRVTFACKAGMERPTQSRGYRTSSTYKKSCPVKIRFALIKHQLNVKQLLLTHENHNCDSVTFAHYPENMRLNDEQTVEVRKMIGVGANKQRIKAELMSTGTTVPLKLIHNIQTKVRREKQQLKNSGELQKLLEELHRVPNARVKVSVNEENELIGIFFQDDRMANVFEKYPEVLLFDATYKLNKRNMPVVLQLCIDGNGETEIASIFICNSESRVAMEEMVDAFQQFNPAWVKTKVILGDKDSADRVVYGEKFPNAVLQICLYHVLRTFNREITTVKRDITQQQRSVVLQLLEKLVYSRSAEEYDMFYGQLCDLQLEKVTAYYNSNWHNIRDQWVTYARNQHSNFLNTTNNRTESLNQKLKMIGNRHSNLLTFFEDLFTSVSVFASERNIRAVKGTMRTPRKRFENEELARYNAFLTPFSFKRLEYEHEMSEMVEFLSITENGAVTSRNGEGGHSVNGNACSCLFYSAMCLPCRHILKFLTIKELDIFVPELCAVRWTKAYYYKSHPALQNVETNAVATSFQPISFVTPRVRSEIDKYKRISSVTKDVNNIVSNMPNSQFEYVYGRLCDIRNELGFGTFNMDLSMLPSANSHTSTASIVDVPVCVAEGESIVTTVTENVREPGHTHVGTVSLEEATNSVQNIDFEKVLLPPVATSIGRPMGSGLTVIGRKRTQTDTPGAERKRYSQGLVTVSEPRPATMSTNAHAYVSDVKQKFCDMNKTDQGLTILHWLTNMSTKDIIRKKITIGDIVQDAMMFTRLRNDGLHLAHVKKYVDTQCYKYLCSEVDRAQYQPWNCAKCKKKLSGYQLMCNKCLDWFHIACLGLTKKEAMSLTYFCTFCN